MWRRAAVYGLMLGALGYCAKVATITVHELGHLVCALVWGGTVHGFRLFRVMGGNAYYDLRSRAGLVVAALGGIGVECVAGALALAAARRLGHRPVPALFLSVFGVGAIVSGACYLTLGLYYEWGDPLSAMRYFVADRAYFAVPLRDRGLWIPGLALVPMVSYLTSREYVREQARWLQTTTRGARLRFTGIALVVGAAAVVPFLLAEHTAMPGRPTPSMSSEAHAAALARSREAERLFSAIRAAEPGLEDQEIWRRVAEQLRGAPPPEPPPRPLPIWPPLLVLALGAGVAALLRHDRPPSAPVTAGRRHIALALGLALAVWIALVLTQGDFVVG